MSQLSQNTQSRITSFGSPRWFQHPSVRPAETERDLEIVSAAQAGSSAAFDELQRQYSRRLFTTILRITKNREDAEDALQDTFLQAFTALPQFERRSSVYSWLTRIAINSALMILRKRRSRREANSVSLLEGCDDYYPLEIEDKTPNPEQLCELRQRRNRLVNAIQGLQPQFRAPIEIQLAEDHSMKDIANTLNISVAAVKARLYRARVHLARRISKHVVARESILPCINTHQPPL
jgi:RNA polymerase sigma-70 factor, ECF subfamily